jgi:protein pelota
MRILKQSKEEGLVKLEPENLEDLWHIERVLEEGDRIRSRSFRRFKTTEGEAGEKKPINVEIDAEKIEFAKFANRLRVTGQIISGTPEEFVQIGSYHTVDIEPGFAFTLVKKRWKNYQIERLRQAVVETKRPRVALVVLDDEKAIFATLRGYGVEFEFELEAKASKRDEKYEEKIKEYFGEIYKKVASYEVGTIIIAGPGFTKDNLREFIAKKDKELLKKIVFESCSYAERSGVYELLKKGVVGIATEAQHFEQEVKAIEELMMHIGKDDGMCAYGIGEVKDVVMASAVIRIFVLDEVLRSNKEVESVIELAEKKKVELLIFSHEGEPGRKLNGLGGLAAILKFRIS